MYTLIYHPGPISSKDKAQIHRMSYKRITTFAFECKNNSYMKYSKNESFQNHLFFRGDTQITSQF